MSFTLCIFKIGFVIVFACFKRFFSSKVYCQISVCISLFFLCATHSVLFSLFWVNYPIIIRQRVLIVMRFLCLSSERLIIFSSYRLFLTHPQYTFSLFACKVITHVHTHVYIPIPNKITHCSRVLLEKLIVSRLVKKFLASRETRRSITAITRARHLSLSWAKSSPLPHSYFLKILFNIIFHIRLGLSNGLENVGYNGFTKLTKCCWQFEDTLSRNIGKQLPHDAA
jgi:hypothetical protein